MPKYEITLIQVYEKSRSAILEFPDDDTAIKYVESEIMDYDSAPEFSEWGNMECTENKEWIHKQNENGTWDDIYTDEYY